MSYEQEYAQAQTAYAQGNYEKAAEIIDHLVAQFPDEPSAFLLRGHIYCYGFRDYELAQEQYELVLQLTEEPDYVEFARNGLEYSGQAQSDESQDEYEEYGDDEDLELDSEAVEEYEDYDDTDEDGPNLGEIDLDMGDDSYGEQPQGSNGESDWQNPFSDDDEDNGEDISVIHDYVTEEVVDDEDPFSASQFLEESSSVHEDGEEELEAQSLFTNTPDSEDDQSGGEELFDLDAYAEDSPDQEQTTFFTSKHQTNQLSLEKQSLSTVEEEQVDLNPEIYSEEITEDGYAGHLSSGELPETVLLPSENQSHLSSSSLADSFKNIEENENTVPTNTEDSIFSDEDGEQEKLASITNQSVETSEPSLVQEKISDPEPEIDESDQPNTRGFLEEFDVFNDDLDGISTFDVSEAKSSQEEPDTGFDMDSEVAVAEDLNPSSLLSQAGSGEEEMFTINDNEAGNNVATNFTSPSERSLEPIVEIEQGNLGWFDNFPLEKKNLCTATITGLVSALAVAIISVVSSTLIPEEDKAKVLPPLRNAGAGMAMAALASGFGTSWLWGRFANQHIMRSTEDLQAQFQGVCQGNLDAKATVFAADEFGRLATEFNQMARVILTTTSEAQRKAEEQEQQKEDLQRQVIRLLDDVEGAARGDLTVQAEVTADVLGAVADAFNLTIQNLREIVEQVKEAAKQVNQNSTENEKFARDLSKDALRQAEELAVTLNSVQMMTDAIQRVADNAREAEEVARSASATAVRGGEAVEHTVVGILQIRETVAETTRKVKRLGEASQKISQIVAVIANIASRTNLLALNASIEAARAGEAGRGFAIVADEVRQLADKAAKALKEIEQIVLQIQSETSSVMTAMEEGTQQVIDGTKRAEQAKRALEDIVQVSNRIDALVRSIKADTVEQEETSKAVAHVMQSVELTAQETSQESQRVSNSLQNLVVIARNLLTSVERFRVDVGDEVKEKV